MTEKEKIFNDIVKDYDKSEHFSGKLCPDQYVCNIEIIKNYYFNQNARKNIFAKDSVTVIEKNIPNAENILILILESPHVAEYFEQLSKKQFDKIRENLCPAMGKFSGDTGYNIKEHIAEIFPNFSNYHLILMNAIPFQCSLGFSLSKKENENKKRRDEVFSAAWNNNAVGKNFFEGRLRELLEKLQKNSKNVIIVNACTIATDKNFEDLHCMACKIIQDVMKKNKFALTFYHTVHPSSGHWCRKNYKLNDSKRNVNERCQNRRKCKQSQIQIVKN